MYLCKRYPKPSAVGFRIPPLHRDPKFIITFRKLSEKCLSNIKRNKIHKAGHLLNVKLFY